MSRRGIFITFEGGEGCGKSTQIQLLAGRLAESGRKPVLTREPGGTAVGEQVRHVLQYSKDSGAMVPEAELLLFAASRAQLVREVIEPALAGGKTVISDRFLDSTTVYQGVARKIAANTVAGINAFAVGDCRPDITFLLDMDAGAARERMLARRKPDGPTDRMEEQPMAFYEAVRQGYLDLARAEPSRFVLIDAAAAPEEIFASLTLSLEERFHGLFD